MCRVLLGEFQRLSWEYLECVCIFVFWEVIPLIRTRPFKEFSISDNDVTPVSQIREMNSDL